MGVQEREGCGNRFEIMPAIQWLNPERYEVAAVAGAMRSA